jgi:hypothetical protein
LPKRICDLVIGYDIYDMIFKIIIHDDNNNYYLLTRNETKCVNNISQSQNDFPRREIIRLKDIKILHSHSFWDYIDAFPSPAIKHKRHAHTGGYRACDA